jgi:hypothetical protein
MKQVIPEAFFDSISLSAKLDNFLDGFKLEEVHLFSYFSSILFLYKGNTATDWQYQYTITKEGYPFSSEIFEALTRHIQNGHIEQKENFYSITSRGIEELKTFKELSGFSKREPFLEAACTTSILIPYSQTQRALLNDSEFLKAKTIKNNSWIDQSNIYGKFKEISEAVGVKTDDLIIPAVTWISYINENELKKVN